MAKIRLALTLTSILLANTAFADNDKEFDDRLFNKLNNPTVPVPMPVNGVMHQLAHENANIPCFLNHSLRKLERNQNQYWGQCDFEKRIKLSGVLKVSTGIVNHAIGHGANGAVNDSQHLVAFIHDTQQGNQINVDTMNDIWVDRFALNIDTTLNDWAELHLSLLHWNDNTVFKNVKTEWFNRYIGIFQGNGNVSPIEEANIVLANFARSPFYLRFGRQYLDFGWYNKNTTIAPMTQFFTQSLHDAATIGFLDFHGFNGAASAFRSVTRGQVTTDALQVALDRPFDSINNFSASLGYGFDINEFSFDAKVDYMFDMFGVDFFDGYLGNGIVGGVPAGFDTVDGTVTKRRPEEHSSMMSVEILTRYRDLDFKAQYVAVINSMEKGIWSIGGVRASNFSDGAVSGARPHAWGFEVGFSLPILGRDSRLSIATYRTEQSFAGQTSDDVAVAGTIKDYYIPRKRIQFSAEHNLMKSLDVAVTYMYDNDYTEDYFGSINNTSTNAAEGSSFRNTFGTRQHNSLFAVTFTARMS